MFPDINSAKHFYPSLLGTLVGQSVLNRRVRESEFLVSDLNNEVCERKSRNGFPKNL